MREAVGGRDEIGIEEDGEGVVGTRWEEPGGAGRGSTVQMNERRHFRFHLLLAT